MVLVRISESILENLKHSERSLKIRVIELVANVPAKRTELSTFLYNSVEER